MAGRTSTPLLWILVPVVLADIRFLHVTSASKRQDDPVLKQATTPFGTGFSHFPVAGGNTSPPLNGSEASHAEFSDTGGNTSPTLNNSEASRADSSGTGLHQVAATPKRLTLRRQATMTSPAILKQATTPFGTGFSHFPGAGGNTNPTPSHSEASYADSSPTGEPSRTSPPVRDLGNSNRRAQRQLARQHPHRQRRLEAQNQLTMRSSSHPEEEHNNNSSKIPNLCAGEKWKWRLKTSARCKKLFGETSKWTGTQYNTNGAKSVDCGQAYHKCASFLALACCTKPEGPKKLSTFCKSEAEQGRERQDAACDANSVLEKTQRVLRDVVNAADGLSSAVSTTRPITSTTIPLDGDDAEKIADIVIPDDQAPSPTTSTAMPRTEYTERRQQCKEFDDGIAEARAELVMLQRVRSQQSETRDPELVLQMDKVLHIGRMLDNLQGSACNVPEEPPKDTEDVVIVDPLINEDDDQTQQTRDMAPHESQLQEQVWEEKEAAEQHLESLLAGGKTAKEEQIEEPLPSPVPARPFAALVQKHIAPAAEVKDDDNDPEYVISINTTRVSALMLWVQELNNEIEVMETTVHPHGTKWWRYRYQYTIVESLFLIPCLFVIWALQAFLLSLGKRIGALRRMNVEKAPDELNANAYTFFIIHCATLILILAFIWFLGQIQDSNGKTPYDRLAVVVRLWLQQHYPNGNWVAPFVGRSYHQQLQDIMFHLFGAFVLYTIFVWRVVAYYINFYNKCCSAEICEDDEDTAATEIEIYEQAFVHSMADMVLLGDETDAVLQDIATIMEQVGSPVENLGNCRQRIMFPFDKYIFVSLSESTAELLLPNGAVFGTLVVGSLLVCVSAVMFKYPFFFCLPVIFAICVTVFVVLFFMAKVLKAQTLQRAGDAVEEMPQASYLTYSSLSTVVKVATYVLCYSLARLCLSPDIWTFYAWAALSSLVTGGVACVCVYVLVAPIMTDMIVALSMPPNLSKDLVRKHLQLVALQTTSFVRYDGPLREGGEIFEATMTLEEAKAKAVTLKNCAAFHFEGREDSSKAVRVVFKDHVDSDRTRPITTGWSSYKMRHPYQHDARKRKSLFQRYGHISRISGGSNSPLNNSSLINVSQRLAVIQERAVGTKAIRGAGADVFRKT